ncbi:TPA: host cell division inhibitor Icd-like protein, partial [Escherichia coli]|nr:host cell division inhibitor Icd-like protein [Escherichia coli]
MFKNRLISSSASLYDAAVAHMATGFSSLNNQAGSRVYSDMRFFCARNTTLPRIMAGRNGGAVALAGSLIASLLTPLRLATPFSSVLARLRKFNQGASKMAVSA